MWVVRMKPMKQKKMEQARRAGRRSLAYMPGLTIALAILAFAPSSGANSSASAHGPIGVMADHTHDAGEWMVSYRYMRMRMNGSRDNDDRIGANRVLARFPVTPLRMDMEMHMFGLMFAPVDRVTLTAMLPFVRSEMDHVTRTGAKFTTRSDGIGDFHAAALIRLLEEKHHHVHAQLGISFPTGSITEQDRTPASGASKTNRLPYPMQVGSGSYDFLPALTYTGHRGAVSWGLQGRGEVRLNENHAGYRLGNEYALTAWTGFDLASWMSASLRTEWAQALNYRGREESAAVNPVVIPTADPGRRATDRLDFLIGVNLLAPSGPLDGLRLAVEVGIPAYQRVDGPQLETDWLLTTGIQYAF